MVCGLIECLQRPVVSDDIDGKMKACLDRARETIEAVRSAQPLPNHGLQLYFRPNALFVHGGCEVDTAAVAGPNAPEAAPENVTSAVMDADGRRSPIWAKLLRKSPGPPTSSSAPSGSDKPSFPLSSQFTLLGNVKFRPRVVRSRNGLFAIP